MNGTTPQPLLRNYGVYRMDHTDDTTEHFVAILNDDVGDYLYALPRAIPIPGGGFAYDDYNETFLFVDKETGVRLFSSYHDAEWRYTGRLISELVDSGLIAVSASSVGIGTE